MQIPTLEELDLEARVGQCFMVGYVGEGPDPELQEWLARRAVGGVILFARNGCEGEQMRAQITRVRAASPEWPLIALDQEGGPVLRVSEGASDLPSAMALGSLPEPDLVEACGQAAGAELLAMGADLNLAPVLDVNRLEANPGIGLRSFGTRPETVSRIGGSWLRGLRRSGALACGKHFPGKGAASRDAHLSMPVVESPREELEAEDLAPFRALGASGSGDLPALMTSHVLYPALDAERPGTTSPAIAAIAREILGPDGLLISDDLEMGGMAQAEGDLEDGALRCLEAGHDLLLVCHTRELHLSMVARVVAAVEAGRLPAARIDEAAGRVLAWKRRVASLERGSLEALREEHAPQIARAHRESITWIGDRAPLDPDLSWTVYLPRLEGLVQVEEGTGSCEHLQSRLAEGLPGASFRTYSPREAPEETPEPGSAVLVCSYNAHLFEGQASWMRALAEEAPEFNLATLRNPFDARLVPGARRRLLVHGFRRGAQEALAGLLLGEFQPRGTFRFREAL